MSERVRTFSPGEEVVVALGFEHEGDGEIESVEAVFVREGSGEELVFLGDAKKEASARQEARYTARLEAKIAAPAVAPGEYRCARLFARDWLDDWDFADTTGLDLVIRVEPTPCRLRVTARDFL